jgi:sarcosine oxidase subunit delta
MSLQIPCEHCGQRPVAEFAYGEVPEVPAGLSEANALDLDRAFMITNTQGVQREAWFHIYGCRRWTYICRDTNTDLVVDCPTDLD